MNIKDIPFEFGCKDNENNNHTYPNQCEYNFGLMAVRYYDKKMKCGYIDINGDFLHVQGFDEPCPFDGILPFNRFGIGMIVKNGYINYVKPNGTLLFNNSKFLPLGADFKYNYRAFTYCPDESLKLTATMYINYKGEVLKPLGAMFKTNRIGFRRIGKRTYYYFNFNHTPHIVDELGLVTSGATYDSIKEPEYARLVINEYIFSKLMRKNDNI